MYVWMNQIQFLWNFTHIREKDDSNSDSCDDLRGNQYVFASTMIQSVGKL